jgi:Spy/CpxP family protein refolding chaperone
MNRKSGLWIALWVILVVVTGFLAFGHGFHRIGYGPWHGWGRMERWHDGNRFGPEEGRGWYGMGPGMMGGYGPGYGMGPGGGYGPGTMMGPYGAGSPGMGLGTGFGQGMGFGMGGGGYAMMPWLLPDLTSDQAQKIGQLHSELAQRNIGTMQQRWEAQARLNSLYAAEKRDWSAIRAASRKLLELQGQQQDAAIDFQQKADALLTDSQRKEMAAGAGRGYGWMGGPWHAWQDTE